MKSLKKNVKVRMHISAYFDKNKYKSSEIWKGIGTLVNIKSSKSSRIKLLDGNNNLITHPKKISNTLNNHFSTIGSKSEQKIPFTPGNFKDYFNKKDILLIRFSLLLLSLEKLKRL